MICKPLTAVAKCFKRYDLLYFMLLYPFLVTVSLHLNFYHGNRVSKSEFFGDQGDYYMFLPATFIHGWDISRLPANLETDLRAFTPDQKTGKLVNKTTCGIAILWLPFFLATHVLALAFHLPADGFSLFYQKMTVFPAVFYLLLGLFFLRRFLENYVSRAVSWITILLVFAGTNLFYYSMDQGLMAHGNDFFLFSLYLYLLKNFLDKGRTSLKQWLVIAAVAALAILVRPTNILILSWLVLLDTRSLKEMYARMLFFLRPLYSLSFLATAFLVFLPQFIYWHYLSGSWIYYSYPGEGFTNWLRPMILPVWFAPLNGLFLYTPLAILFVAGIVLMILKRIPNGWFLAAFFLLLTYIVASWHVWYFGGSFGSRPFCEFFTLFSLPFAILIQSMQRIRNLFSRSLIVLFMIACCYYNLRLVYSRFYYPGGAWSWGDYFRILDRAGIFRFKKATFTFRNDFENKDVPSSLSTVPDPVRSMVRSAVLPSSQGPAELFSGKADDILDRKIRKVTASVWILSQERDFAGIRWSCCVSYYPGRCVFSREIMVDLPLVDPGKWTPAESIFYLPSWLEPSSLITISLGNPGLRNLYIDDLRIRFE